MSCVNEEAGFSETVFSKDRTNRFELTRQWGHVQSARVLWIMLNPSTADENVDDATVRKVRGFTERLKLTGFTIINLHAFRTSSPKELKKMLPLPYEVEEQNRRVLRKHLASTRYPFKIAAWGMHGRGAGSYHVGNVCRSLAVYPYCLGRTQNGSPRHPLMLPYSALDKMERMDPWEESL